MVERKATKTSDVVRWVLAVILCVWAITMRNPYYVCFGVIAIPIWRISDGRLGSKWSHRTRQLVLTTCSLVQVVLVDIGAVHDPDPTRAGMVIDVSLMSMVRIVSKSAHWTLREFAFLAIVSLMLTIGSFAGIFRTFGLQHPDPAVGIDHSLKSAFYFSLVTWTTLGYGDFQPTEAVRMAAAIEAMLGYVAMAFFIGFALSRAGASHNGGLSESG
ncbi:MAG: ion channel [Planctomycetaceae bacterium]